MLRRVRIGFALLAAVLLATLGFLILRTLATLDRERELEHAAVANRVFDEAEGALADFLRAEQARPVAAYREQPSGVPWMDERPDFVRAYFEIDDRGAIRTSAGEPGLEAEIRKAADAGLTRLGEVADASPDDEKDGSPSEVVLPSPGATLNLQSIDVVTGRAKAGSGEQTESEADDASLYSSTRALETLGRIAKVQAREDAAAAPQREAKKELARRRATPEAIAESAPGLATAAAPLPAVAVEASGLADADHEAIPPRPAAAPIVFAPSRLSGGRLDDERLLLYRTALDDAGRAVRQGLVVSIDGLGAWLTRRVLGESELRDSLMLRLHAGAAESREGLPSDRYVYAYRFAEPFESLSLQLSISPLDDSGNARNIGWLSALLVTASTLGLYAVYRTVAAAVHFAERRSNFAAAVSHELKTPLTAIRMYGEMLRDGMVPDESKRHEYYATIATESERLTRLINNVLEWSKLEKQQRAMCLESGDVTRVVRDVITTVTPHASAQGFEIDLRLPPDLPAARHDPDALAQILYNLIDNAIKYARGHEPARIEVVAEALETEIAIRVRDHGPGVDPDKLPLVFEAFYRAEDELTRQTKGTGIGLALALGLAESMGGRLLARNHPDGGFDVELRLARA
ncbi:MAG: ATP-binding protein [Myxococcota bacterium]